MKRTPIRLVAIGLGAGILVSAAAIRAQDTQEAGFDMDTLAKYSTPGEMHQKLQPIVGNWEMNVRLRMSAEAPWEESPATAEREWILGERFVQETVEGDWGGQPFEGLGLFGYDIVRGEYCYTWVDNVSTGMMTGAGSIDGNTISYEGTVSDPMRGIKDKWYRSSLRIESDGKNVYESWEKGEDGAEFMAMQIICTRR